MNFSEVSIALCEVGIMLDSHKLPDEKTLFNIAEALEFYRVHHNETVKEVRKLRKELDFLHNIYRWHKQSVEPAPTGIRVVTFVGCKDVWSFWSSSGEEMKNYPEAWWRFPDIPCKDNGND